VLGSDCRVTFLQGTPDGAYGNTGSMQVQWRSLPGLAGTCNTTTDGGAPLSLKVGNTDAARRPTSSSVPRAA